jgi:hypothetical protein
MNELLQDEPVKQNTLNSGLAVGSDKPAPHTSETDARLIRYLFNPFVIADLRSLSVAVGHDYLPNGVFIKIDAVEIRQAVHDPHSAPSPLAGRRDGAYEFITRQPGAIAAELLEIYAGSGVVEIAALRSMDNDEFLGKVTNRIFGKTIPSRTDVYETDFPVPVLPLWFENIEANSRVLIAEKELSDKELADFLKKVLSELKTSFRTAIAYAKGLTQGANARMLDPNNRNKQLNPLERRAYLALGEDIPDQMPTVSRSENSRSERMENALISLTEGRQQASLQQREVAPLEDSEEKKILRDQLAQNTEIIRQQGELLGKMGSMIERFMTPADVPAEVSTDVPAGENSNPAGSDAAAAGVLKNGAKTTAKTESK